MTQPRAATYEYSIDESDRLVSVSNTWVDFARANGAPELTRERVVGRPLWEFMEGAEIREIYELLFGWVRRHQSVIELPFRCDSPDCLRFMRLRLTPSEAGRIDLAAVLDREERRPHLMILDCLSARSEYAFPLCSFCRRIFAFGAWLEPEEAIARLGWLESRHPPQIEEDVCGYCSSEARAHAQSHPADPSSRPEA